MEEGVVTLVWDVLASEGASRTGQPRVWSVAGCGELQAKPGPVGSKGQLLAVWREARGPAGRALQ